jgi:hypothetical protein
MIRTPGVDSEIEDDDDEAIEDEDELGEGEVG